MRLDYLGKAGGLLALLCGSAFGVPRGSILYGHYAYPEAGQELLAPAGTYRESREVKLRTQAAIAFKKMEIAAEKEGIAIVPISGFRSLAYQEGLFDRAIKRYGSREAAARWVAPPGHSEHHTGWALDLGDGDRPQTDVEQSFEDTPVFRWLQSHAADYGFEISFPKGGPQKVSYEPWHWRYVGSLEAEKLFHPDE